MSRCGTIQRYGWIYQMENNTWAPSEWQSIELSIQKYQLAHVAYALRCYRIVSQTFRTVADRFSGKFSRLSAAANYLLSSFNEKETLQVKIGRTSNNSYFVITPKCLASERVKLHSTYNIRPKWFAPRIAVRPISPSYCCSHWRQSHYRKSYTARVTATLDGSVLGRLVHDRRQSLHRCQYSTLRLSLVLWWWLGWRSALLLLQYIASPAISTIAVPFEFCPIRMKLHHSDERTLSRGLYSTTNKEKERIQ